MRIVGNEVKFLKLSDNDLISNAVDLHGGFDNHVLRQGMDLLKDIDTGAVLDIGANMGSFTIPMAKHKPKMGFVSFEPQRMVYHQLCGNLAINNISNVKAINVGLGEQDELLKVTVPDYAREENIGAFSLDEEVRGHDDYLCKTADRVEMIEIRQLDSFQIGNVRLIKIDVEGMELNVLKGAVQTLEHSKYPPILFEAWTHKSWFLPRRQELMDYLEKLGYTIHSFGDDNVAIHKGV